MEIKKLEITSDDMNHIYILTPKNELLRYCRQLSTQGGCSKSYSIIINGKKYILKAFNYDIFHPDDIEIASINKAGKLQRSMDLFHKNFVPIKAINIMNMDDEPFCWGYIMPNIPQCFPNTPDVDFLMELSDAVKWGHDHGIYIVDLDPDNIRRLGKNTPVIIDRDGHSIVSEDGDELFETEEVPNTFYITMQNFKYKDTDIFEDRCKLLKNIDIINLSQLALYCITGNPFWRHQNIISSQIPGEIEALFTRGLIDIEGKEHLENILSDSSDKVYPKLVLNQIGQKQKQ